MSDQSINFNKILKDSQETFLNPRGYFGSMPLTGGFAEPVIKAVVYGTIAGLLALLWSVLGFGVAGAGLWGGAIGVLALIYTIIGAVIGLFIGGVIMLVISAICGGNTDYEANVRVSASLMVMYPINAFLAFFNGINYTLGSIISLFVSLYSIYLLYLAVSHSLKGKESSARIVAVVLLALSLLFFFTGQRSTKSFRDYEDMFEEEMVD